jgi:hypothetical protein
LHHRHGRARYTCPGHPRTGVAVVSSLAGDRWMTLATASTPPRTLLCGFGMAAVARSPAAVA